jgi:hypothetical protein
MYILFNNELGRSSSLKSFTSTVESAEMFWSLAEGSKTFWNLEFLFCVNFRASVDFFATFSILQNNFRFICYILGVVFGELEADRITWSVVVESVDIITTSLAEPLPTPRHN